MPITTKKIYVAHFIRCGSTFINEFIFELDDFEAAIPSHFFEDKIFKKHICICSYREPEEWYFSQWNYARQRKRGYIYRLIHSRIFRLKHLKASIGRSYLSTFKIFLGIFINIKNPNQYFEEDSLFNFIKLLNSMDFKKITGFKNFSHNQGAMFDWLCLSSFSNKTKLCDEKDPEKFLQKNSSINHYIYLHGMDKYLFDILEENGYDRAYLEMKLDQITPNRNRTKDNLNIKNYLNNDIINYLEIKETFIHSLVQNNVHNKQV
tara:strand:- start:2825 stop:3613 length:789 start_codon:yes stop_codon:yes gene_type:complete